MFRFFPDKRSQYACWCKRWPRSPEGICCMVNLLTHSFEENKSVNYIVKQDQKRKARIRALMNYAFEICYRFGNVYLAEDKKACALLVLPDKKKTTFSSILLDLKLICSCIGIGHIGKTMRRELKIKKLQPKRPMYYLWFIGVEPDVQGQGIGSRLLTEIIEEAHRKKGE